MLKAMRKNLKQLAPTLWIVIIAFLVSIFAVWGGAGSLGERRDSNTIVKIGKEKISADFYVQSLQQRIESLRQQFNELDENFIQQLNIPQQVLEQVIQRHLLLQVAQDLRIHATDEEIGEKIKAVFQREGQFIGFEEYQKILNWNRMSVSEYERMTAQDIIIEKTVKVLTSGVTVSPEELWDNYKNSNESTKLEYLIIPVEKMETPEVASPEELQAYFQERQTDYQLPEKRQGEYVFFNSEELKAELQLTEAEIKDYYEENQDQFKDPATTRVSRIYLPFEGNEKELVLSEIQILLERIQQGEDFGQVARERSKDDKAVDNGDWGMFEWRQLSQQEQDIIGGLEAGEVSEIVELAEGAALLKVTEKADEIQRTLEEVRDRIQTIVLDRKAQELADEKVAELEKAAEKENDLILAAQKMGLQTHKTGLLKEGDAIDDIDPSGSISRALFSLEQDSISTPIYTYKGVGLAVLQQIEVSRQATFEEAQEDIRGDYDQERRVQLALEKAQSLKQESRRSTLEQLSEKYEFEFKTAEEHKRGQYLGVIGENSDVDAFSFEQALDQISDPIKYNQGYILMRVLERKEVTREEFEENRETERQTFLDTKRNQVFASFYSKLREEKNVEPNYGLFLRINSELLGRFSR
jgi:peptidyl-prolyl cis-trans isomerase D